MTEIIRLMDSYDKALSKSISVLNNGGVIVFPTDTVYGLAAKYDHFEAIQKIYQVKGREQTKALPVLIGNLDQLQLLTSDIPLIANKLSKKFWPGPLTLILDKRNDLTSPLSMDESIGVRMPEDEFVKNLAKNVGPLATTSANRSGYPSAVNIIEVLNQIGDFVDLIVDGGESKTSTPSTVVDCRGEQLKILREGVITNEELLSI